MYRQIELITYFYGILLVFLRNIQPAVGDFALPALGFVVLCYFSGNPADTADTADTADLQQPFFSFHLYLLSKMALCKNTQRHKNRVWIYSAVTV